MKRNWNVGVSALAITVAMAVNAQAQAQESQATASSTSNATVLKPIIVTGSRIPQQISETARTIRVVEAEEIEAETRSGKTLQAILSEKIPGFDPASEGARTSYGQNLRGRTALILIDGVSLNSARGLSRQFDSIDPFNIARVEVLSGATAIYGGNATGGVINIITKKGKDAELGLHSEVTVGVESGFGGSKDFDRNAKAAVTYNAEAWDARLSIAGDRSGALYDGSGIMVLPDVAQTSNAFNKRLDFLGSVGFQIDDTRRLEISSQYFDSRQDPNYGLFYGVNLVALRDPSVFEARDGYSSDFNPRTRRAMFDVTYKDEDFLEQQLLLQAAVRREEIQFNPFSGGTYFFGSTQDTNYYTLKAALVAEPTDSLKITYGIDADHDAFSSRQNIFNMARIMSSGGLDFDTIGITGLYPDIDVSTIAGFAEVSYEATDRLNLSAGLRYQFVHTKVSDHVGTPQQVAILQGSLASADTIPGGSINYDDVLFNAGATYDLTENQQVYANFSQGFELPDPGKYYGVGTYSGGTLIRGVSVADSALQSIKTNSYEIGYRFDDGTYSLEGAGYYSLSDKSIALNRTTMAVSVLNEDRRVYGLEGRVGAKLDHGFDVGLLGQWVKTEVKGSNGWRDASIDSAAVSKVGGHIGWTNDALNVKFSGQHLFDMTDANAFKIDGYTLFDLTGGYKFETANTTLNFGIHNLFDTEYTTLWGSRAKSLYAGQVPSRAVAEEVFDFNGRGRTFAISLTKVF